MILVDPGGTLPSAGLVGTMVPDVSAELLSPMSPVGTVLPCDEEKGLFPIVLTGELSSVKAIPFPARRDPVITQLHTDMLVEDCSNIVNRDVIRNICWAVPEGIGDPAMVAMIRLDAMPGKVFSYMVRTSAGSGIFVMSLRQSMECLFIMVVICVIRMNPIGKIRTTLCVRNMSNSIILMPWKEWN